MAFLQRFARGELRLTRIEAFSGGVFAIVVTLLMGQAFIPFPTAMMGEYPRNPLAVSLFGSVMAANTLLFVALHAYVLTRLFFIVPPQTRRAAATAAG